jgi:adenylate kinase
VLRAAIAAGTPLGREARGFMDRGDLVPDAVILGIVREELASPETAGGVILDGVVRTTAQAQGMSGVLAELGRKMDAILFFDVPAEELVRRLSNRLVCEKCQTAYPGGEPGSACAKCGGKLVRRTDDDPASVRRRLVVYEEQTAPVLDWYERNGVQVLRVDAVGQLDTITQRALDALTR